MRKQKVIKCGSKERQRETKFTIEGEKRECWKGVFRVGTKVEALGTRKDQ